MRSKLCVDAQIYRDTNFAVDLDSRLRGSGVIVTDAVLICINTISEL